MNKLFRKIHLWLSVPLGLIISIICFTGAIMVFEKEITEAANPSLYNVEHPDGTRTLTPSEIADRVRQQLSDTVELASMQLPADPDRTYMLTIKGDENRTLSVNPYTGEINGYTKSLPFFQTVKKLHRWLLDSPQKKGSSSVGKTFVALTTTLLVIILISGLIIWIPRTRKALKNRLTVAFGKGTHRFIYDSHVSLGFYCTIFILMMALTGLTWSYGWYRTFVYDLFGATSKTAATPSGTDSKKDGGENVKAVQDLFDYAVWNIVADKLNEKYPQQTSISLDTRQAKISLPGNMPKTNTATFDPESGEITSILPYSQIPKSDKMKGWILAVHTGSWGGVVTKILYFLAALIGGTLPLSGYYMWWKRTRRRRKA